MIPIIAAFAKRNEKKKMKNGMNWNVFQTSESSKPEDLFWAFRHFFRFGKIVGVVPFDGVFTGMGPELKLKLKSFGTIYNLIVLLLLIVNLVIAFMGLYRFGGQNATEWAWSAESFIFYLMGCFVHGYFLLRGQGLLDIFNRWLDLSLDFSRVDTHLERDANLMAGVIFTSAILENVLLQIIFFAIPKDAESYDKSPLLRYYEKAQNHWGAFIPYHGSLALLIFASNKFCLYAWNFADLLITLLARAIYHKFKALNEIGRKMLYTENNSQMGLESHHALLWQNFVKEYGMLSNILKTFEDFLSPLIIASYAINCFYICLQMHLGLTASENSNVPAQKAYAMWSFLHLIARVLLLSVNAAKINDHAKASLELLYSCPTTLETREIERLRFKLSVSRPGLNGLGCFVITRPFILKIISVIFTIEIVLLQAPGGNFCEPEINVNTPNGFNYSRGKGIPG